MLAQGLILILVGHMRSEPMHVSQDRCGLLILLESVPFVSLVPTPATVVPKPEPTPTWTPPPRPVQIWRPEPMPEPPPSVLEPQPALTPEPTTWSIPKLPPSSTPSPTPDPTPAPQATDLHESSDSGAMDLQESVEEEEPAPDE